MKPVPVLAAALAAACLLANSAPAQQCAGEVVGVRPISQYNHARGNGFLAVRVGPGSSHQQIGELYLGDQVWVAERQGNWLYVGCSSGLCTTPKWGMEWPQGWAYAKYLSVGGDCP